MQLEESCQRLIELLTIKREFYTPSALAFAVKQAQEDFRQALKDLIDQRVEDK